MAPCDVVVGTFAPDLAVLADVRDLVASSVRAWGHPATDDLLVVVNELVANAIDHAGTAVHLSFWSEAPDHVRVEVTDSGAGRPEMCAAYRDGTRGMGLRIVDQMAVAWGVVTHEADKTVWAVVAVAP